MATTAKQTLAIDKDLFKRIALLARALNHPLRQKILKLIDENGQMPVSKIYARLRLEQSVTSQHLAILRKHKFVNTERDGQFIYYSVNYGNIKEAHLLGEKLLDAVENS